MRPKHEWAVRKGETNHTLGIGVENGYRHIHVRLHSTFETIWCSSAMGSAKGCLKPKNLPVDTQCRPYFMPFAVVAR